MDPIHSETLRAEVRLAQRIPTRIHIDAVPEGVRISSGMTCTVVVAALARDWAIPKLIRSSLTRWAPAAETQMKG